MQVVWTLPFGFLVTMAVINCFDASLEEAARDMGHRHRGLAQAAGNGALPPRFGRRAGSFTRCYGRWMACQPVVLGPSDSQSHADWPEVSDSKVRSTSQRSSSSYSRTSSAVFVPVFTYV